MPQYGIQDEPVKAGHPLVSEAEETRDGILRGIEIQRKDMDVERQRLVHLGDAHAEAAKVYRYAAAAISKFLGEDEAQVSPKAMSNSYEH